MKYVLTALFLMVASGAFAWESEQPKTKCSELKMAHAWELDDALWLHSPFGTHPSKCANCGLKRRTVSVNEYKI